MNSHHYASGAKILGALLLGFFAAWGAMKLLDMSKPSSHEIGQLPSSLPAGGDYTLQTVNGELKSQSLRGKVVVLYFGYTACPDICPTSMATMKQAFELLKPAELAQIQGVFVSVDPERDTLKHIQTYAQYFHPSILGASADLSYLEKLVRQYDAFFRKVKMEGSAMDYTVDHTATIYIIDQQGKLRELVQHAVPPQQLTDAIRKLLK